MTFDEFLRAHGLQPRMIRADGKWRRCPTSEHPRKRNGSYKLAPGGTIGWCQDWATMDTPAQWVAEKGVVKRATIDHDKMVADHRKIMAERQQAIADARAFYANCDPLRGGHPYLETHRLDMRGCYGLKIDIDGWIVVPALKDGQVVSYQRISPTGDKRFAKGAPIQESSYTIERKGAATSILCEGLATGLALFAALPNSRIIVGWHASNLVNIKLPRGWRVVAADNDHKTAERIGKNPGIEAAKEAARQLGCCVAYPDSIEGTDWCDYRNERFALRRLYPPKFESEAKSQQVIDAEIRLRVMAQARFR